MRAQNPKIAFSRNRCRNDRGDIIFRTWADRLLLGGFVQEHVDRAQRKTGPSLNRTYRDHCPDVSAALTTVAFDQSGPRWLGISDLIAEPEGPTFISYKVARRRLDRLRS